MAFTLGPRRGTYLDVTDELKGGKPPVPVGRVTRVTGDDTRFPPQKQPSGLFPLNERYLNYEIRHDLAEYRPIPRRCAPVPSERSTRTP